MSQRDSYFFPASDDTRLFATTTMADSANTSNVGVVFCHSFGEERQKAYRSTFLFSELLASSGYHSFRFDYRGIGDSDGGLIDTNVDLMVADTIDAIQEAKKRLNVEKIVLLGIRIGAAVALRAATKESSIEHCILWNPNAKGAQFFRELMRTEMIISLARKKSGEQEPDHPPGTTEVDADLVTDEFVEQMKAIDLTAEPIGPNNLLITTRSKDKREIKDSKAIEESASAQNKHIEVWNEELSEFWSARSMHDAFFPHATFDRTIEWLSKHVGDQSE